MNKKNRKVLIYIFCLICFFALILLPLAGRPFLSFSVYWSKDADGLILRSIRLPRSLTAFTAGALLALCGLVFQTIFRNDLAGPYVLGISSASAFGASLAGRLAVFMPALLVPLRPLSSLLAGLAGTFLLLFLSGSGKRFSALRVILTGVALNFFFSALVLFFHYTGDPVSDLPARRWLMGSIGTEGYGPVLVLFAVFLVWIFVLWLLREHLNVLLLGEDLSRARGLNTGLFRTALVVCSCVAVSVCVSFTGPVAFTGLVAPHIVKLILGKDHWVTVPVSALGGGIFLLICFTLSRTLLYPAELPVGVLTSFLGAPFFLYLLSRKNEFY